jgi:predicted methyltransferase
VEKFIVAASCYLSGTLTPLVTSEVFALLEKARRASAATVQCSMDLQRSTARVEVFADHWSWNGTAFPFPESYKERTIYYWSDQSFQPVARYGTSLIKLIPTNWGPPTFEIDGVKMLPTARISPYVDAQHKVELIEPRGKVILDCCAGLGYFAVWCIRERAAEVISFEKNADVIWLRGLNPWSPPPDKSLTLTHADVCQAITLLPNHSVDAVLHDPPRFALAGELYSQKFYDQLARVLRRKGRLFHYTGAPNKIARGRELAHEVSVRLRIAGFDAAKVGDGILAVRS